jgi:hypothetical protein
MMLPHAGFGLVVCFGILMMALIAHGQWLCKSLKAVDYCQGGNKRAVIIGTSKSGDKSAFCSVFVYLCAMALFGRHQSTNRMWRFWTWIMAKLM